jgi:hypothetical protein
MALSTNLISYWKFDESSGNAADSVGSNTLTNNGSATFGTGLLGNAASLGTTNTTKSFSVANNINAFTSNFTYNLWVQILTVPTNNGSAYELLSDSDNSTANNKGQMGIQYNQASGATNIYINRNQFGANAQYGVALNLGTNTWHMLTYTWNGATIALYVDGSSSATVSGASTQTGTSTSIGTGNYFNIGKEGSNAGREASIKIDETGVWSRALSTSEITQLYNSGAGLAYPFGTTVTGDAFQMGAVF